MKLREGEPQERACMESLELARLSPEGAVALLAQMRGQIQQLTRVDEIKDLHDKFEAIRFYATKKEHWLDIQNEAAVNKLYCERRGGALMKETARRVQSRAFGSLCGSVHWMSSGV